MAGGGRKILIIDDDEGIRQILRRAVEAAGYAVLEASNGAAGLKRFRDDGADLVITDIIMPEREGVETIVALSKESPDTPIIACSGGGGGGADYLEIATKLGAWRVFPKPFSLNAIVGAVDELLGGGGRGNPPKKPGSAA